MSLSCTTLVPGSPGGPGNPGGPLKKKRHSNLVELIES